MDAPLFFGIVGVVFAIGVWAVPRLKAPVIVHSATDLPKGYDPDSVRWSTPKQIRSKGREKVLEGFFRRREWHLHGGSGVQILTHVSNGGGGE